METVFLVTKHVSACDIVIKIHVATPLLCDVVLFSRAIAV